jgi:hypothetical protein
MQPEGIPAGLYTHINVAYVYITDTFEMLEFTGAYIARVSRLKKRYNGLRVNIAIGMSIDTPSTPRKALDLLICSKMESRWLGI